MPPSRSIIGTRKAIFRSPAPAAIRRPGFLDYIGADGTAAGVVDHPAPIGTVITCVACHNATTLRMTSVTFPSGLKVDHLGADARCMTCHQGVESTKSVNKALANQGDDTVNPKQPFINVHYRAAGATLYGNQAQVAYQYPGKTYAGQIRAPRALYALHRMPRAAHGRGQGQ